MNDVFELVWVDTSTTALFCLIDWYHCRQYHYVARKWIFNIYPLEMESIQNFKKIHYAYHFGICQAVCLYCLYKEVEWRRKKNIFYMNCSLNLMLHNLDFHICEIWTSILQLKFLSDIFVDTIKVLIIYHLTAKIKLLVTGMDDIGINFWLK